MRCIASWRWQYEDRYVIPAIIANMQEKRHSITKSPLTRVHLWFVLAMDVPKGGAKPALGAKNPWKHHERLRAENVGLQTKAQIEGMELLMKTSKF